jgi:DNA polymerase alpha subunit A
MKMEDEEEKGEVPEVAADVVVGELGIPQEEDGSINMFWIDAYWDKERSGRLFIFGKIRTGEAKGKSTFSSVCVQVEGLQRQVYIQPREYILDAEGNATEHKVSLIDHVFPEFFQIAKSKGIKGHKCKPVTRNYMYHFQEKDVPATGEYLKCVYSAEYAPLDSALAGRSFKRIFGTNQSTLELFLLKRDLMGPCWINIKGAQGVAAPLSHCKHEFRVTDSKSVIKLSKQLESPPLSVMSIHMQTVKNAAEHANEIAMISALVHQEVSCEGPTDNPEKKLSSFTIARKLDGQAWPIDIQAKIEEHNKANPASLTSIQANTLPSLILVIAQTACAYT